jgi:hypothetical protein
MSRIEARMERMNGDCMSRLRGLCLRRILPILAVILLILCIPATSTGE